MGAGSQHSCHSRVEPATEAISWSTMAAESSPSSVPRSFTRDVGNPGITVGGTRNNGGTVAAKRAANYAPVRRSNS
jgi:hypothetical protein